MLTNYKNYVLRPNKSVLNSRAEADTSAKLGDNIFKVPVVCSNMPAVLTIDIVEQFDHNAWFYVYPRVLGTEDVYMFVNWAQKHLRIVSISVGIGKEWDNLLKTLSQAKMKIDYITVDVAHSHNDNILHILARIAASYPDAYVIVGNGCTKEWIDFLEDYGVHCAKTGIGVSQACQTYQVTGFGSSTISSIQECVGASHGIKIMSDGGITVNKQGFPFIGEIAKALVIGGADWVMSGALFKHCSNSPAVKDGFYYGNASEKAKGNKKHIEGRSMPVQSNGYTIKEMMDKIEESLRSSISYSGGRNIKEMKELTTWEEVK